MDIFVLQIDLRNTELQDMQQKCAKAGDDVRSEQRWNNVRNLVSARAALKRIFDVVGFFDSLY